MSTQATSPKFSEFKTWLKKFPLEKKSNQKASLEYEAALWRARGDKNKEAEYREYARAGMELIASQTTRTATLREEKKATHKVAPSRQRDVFEKFADKLGIDSSTYRDPHGQPTAAQRARQRREDDINIARATGIRIDDAALNRHIDLTPAFLNSYLRVGGKNIKWGDIPNAQLAERFDKLKLQTDGSIDTLITIRAALNLQNAFERKTLREISKLG